MEDFWTTGQWEFKIRFSGKTYVGWSKIVKNLSRASRTIGNDIWMQIPSGWIAARYGGKVYVE